ncbi:MAG: hypothetical protein ACRBCT_09025 [Alphaproteobacteria bacterium]
MKLKTLLPLIILATLIIGGITAWQVPTTAHKKVQTAFNNIGITAPLPTPQKFWGGLRYTDITLDEDEQNTIGQLSIAYSIPTIIFGGTFDAMLLKELSINGELNTNNTLSIAALGALPDTLPAKRVNIKDSTLSLTSANFGNFRINGDIQAQQENENITITGALSSKENHLEAITKLNATVTPDGKLNATIAIENGKMLRRYFKITRVSGEATLGENPTLNINAGGLKLLGLPWQNANITIQNGKTILTAKAIGAQGIELSLEKETETQKETAPIRGRLYAENAEDLGYYLRQQNIFPDTIENAEILESQGPIEINFTTQNRHFAYEAKHETTKQTATGRLRTLNSGLFVEVN